MKSLKVILTISCIILVSSHAYSQGGMGDTLNELVDKTTSQVKGIAANRNLGNVVMWKIEVDNEGVVDVVEFTNEMNVRLIEEGVLRDRRINFTGIQNRNDLIEKGALYEISAVLYGKETVVSGDVVKVSFELFDIESGTIIWESVISGGEAVVAAGLSALALGKWSTLGVGGVSGVGALTTLALFFDTFYNKHQTAETLEDSNKFLEQAQAFLTWSIIMGSVSLVSSGVSTYLFLIDQDEESVALIDILNEERITLNIKGNEIVLSGQIKF